MNALQQAAEVVLREARRYEALIAAAKELEKYGSMEQAISEAHGKIAELWKKKEAVENEIADSLNQAQTKANNAQSQAVSIVEDAKRVAAEIEAKAKGAFDAANIESRRLIASAKTKADAMLAEADKRMSAANETATDARRQCEEAKQVHSNIKALADAEEARLTAARAKLRELLS